jgi:CubicO group peptidase (beta-lactamase class C family)
MRGSTRERPNSRHGFVRPVSWAALNASAMIALAACGGGGGGGDSGQGQNPVNAAPTASAGADQTIQLPTNSVQLTGSATDDNLPAGRTLTYAWTSSPAGVTFANAAAASTTATFGGAGTYTVTLTVSDGALTGTDALNVVVQATANVAPVVSAGADQAIELPTSTATVTGSATDDGLPANSTLTYAWTATPAGVAFANAAAASTTATFAAAGTYTLTLTASDSALSGTDALTVTVNPAVYPAADLDETNADHGWTRVAPADVGMDLTLLQQAENYAVTNAGGAGLISRRGRLVHRWGDIDTRYRSQSTTKSVGGMALGFAIDDGLVAIGDTAISHIPYIGNPPGGDARLAAITILQLATHTAGFKKDGGYLGLDYTPGTTWLYSDGGLNWLADLLTNVFAQDLNAVISARVWANLGLNNNGDVNNFDDVEWRSNLQRPTPPPGAPAVPHRELSSGMSMNANAMARVGLLFLRNGVWSNGRIVSESFVNTVKTPPPQTAATTNPKPADFPGATTNYGVLWWTNVEGLLPNVPRDAYWAWGQWESLIVVIPSLDLVIARIGPLNNVDEAGRVFGEFGWNGDYAVLAPFLDPIVQSVAP